MKRKRDWASALLVSGCLLQASAILQRLSDSNQLDDAGSNANDSEEEDVDDSAMDVVLSTGTSLQCLSIGVLYLWSTIVGSGSRGPYDQQAKCLEYFLVALSWPDRAFRHTFR